MTVDLSFTVPPSVNAIWRNVGRKAPVLSPAYRKWRVTAGWEIKTQDWEPIKGPFTAQFYLPAKMRGDIDNRTKGALDLLQSLGVIENDSLLSEMTVKRGGANTFRVVLSPVRTQ